MTAEKRCFFTTPCCFGALGILIPIIIHLLNRRSNRVVEWGAMNFLFESFAIRNRRIQLEEALLMASRCLLVGLLALALARPFIPPGSNVPWLLVMPLLLIGVVGLGVGAVFHASAFLAETHCARLGPGSAAGGRADRVRKASQLRTLRGRGPQ
ncbi:MAG: BatA domain-containing protein [Verrucomicrobiales bacterium]